MPHITEDDLAVLALGEQLPGCAAHLAGCERCRAELASLRNTVRTAQGADIDVPPAPPEVWQRITAELGLQAPAGSGPPVGRRRIPVGRRRIPAGRRGRVLLGLAACCAAAAVVAGVAGLVRSGPATPPGPAPAPVSELQALGAPGSSGDVRLVGNRLLQVTTRGLARGPGFYEVWLMDPASGRLVALGTLDAHGDAELALPAGIRLADYPDVDVSAEPDDGNPAHSGDSVLRGPRPA